MRIPRRPQPAVSACQNLRQGFVLIVVLITIVLLTVSTYTFTLLMLHEQEATQLMGRQIQSRYLVESGVDYLRLYLSTDDDTIRALGGIWDNQEQFQNKIVSINPLNPLEIGRFSIIASNLDTNTGIPDGFRAGIIDESSKLNLNTLTHADTWFPDTGEGGGGRQLLMALPLMTEDIADAILDWLDADSEPRTLGIEDYSGQSPPYGCKNGPMDSIEELLLVRGVTPQLLFGLDNNHNGILDLDEQFAEGNAVTTEPDMQLGWANYLTLFSKESNLIPATGLQRVNINSSDLQQMSDDMGSTLNSTWANFIIAYRQNGPAPDDLEPLDGQPNFVEADTSIEGSFTFTSVLDLIDARTTLPYLDEEGEEQTALLVSPITMSNLGTTLPLLMDNLTTIDGDNVPGRINIMQAPRAVLQGIPGMTEMVLERIIEERQFELDGTAFSELFEYETWLLLRGIVDLETMKAMMPFICCGGDVYKAEIVGYFDDNVATSRAEVILDTTVPLPRILFWRDKSHLQRGYTIDILGTDLNTEN